MNDAKQIVTMSNHLWVDEVDIVGASIVDDIAQSAVSGGTFLRSGGGADMDVKAVLDPLLEAATLIKVTLEIKSLLTDRAGKAPRTTDLKTEVEKDVRVTALNQDVRSRLGEIVDIISTDF